MTTPSSRRQIHCARLRQRRAARAHQQPRAGVVRQRVEGARQHIGLHHHAGPAAGRRVVDGAVLVGGCVADVVRVERPEAGRERLAGEACRQRSGKHFRKNGQHARAPHHQSPFRPRESGDPRTKTEAPMIFALDSRLRGNERGLGCAPHIRYSPDAGGTTTICLAFKSTFGTAASVNDSISGAPASGVISIMSPAPKLCTAVTLPSSVPSRRHRRQANEVGMIECVLFLDRRQAVARHEKSRLQSFSAASRSVTPAMRATRKFFPGLKVSISKARAPSSRFQRPVTGDGHRVLRERP